LDAQNDYFDHLFESSGGDQRMATLNRDVQALNLSSNQIGRLAAGEFAQKKFRNLQKLHISHNKLVSIEPGAFFKLTGLVELDLSDNLLERLEAPALGGAANTKTASTTETAPATAGAGSSSSSPTVSEHEKRDDNHVGRTNKTNRAGGGGASVVAASRSFLQDLGQLRQLNLNSNKLKRIGEFAFSSLARLRQLYLSR
jgi:Leucine-rich repeat (LRR) protein